MPTPRPLLALAAALALATACTSTSTIAGAGTPALGITPPRSPSPTPHPTYNGVASMTGEEALGSAYDALLHAASVRVKAAFIAVGTRGPTT